MKKYFYIVLISGMYALQTNTVFCWSQAFEEKRQHYIQSYHATHTRLSRPMYTIINDFSCGGYSHEEGKKLLEEIKKEFFSLRDQWCSKFIYEWSLSHSRLQDAKKVLLAFDIYFVRLLFEKEGQPYANALLSPRRLDLYYVLSGGELPLHDKIRLEVELKRARFWEEKKELRAVFQRVIDKINATHALKMYIH